MPVAIGTAEHDERALNHARTSGLFCLRTGASVTLVVVSTTELIGATTVSKAVKKAISLPADLAAEAEAIARDENKSLSAVVQDALRAMKRSRLRAEYRELQGYWSTRARDKGVLSERELERLLRR
jgi:hypothetical protein